MEREVVHVPQVVKLKKYNIYQRVTGKFVSIAYGESAYDAICWYGVQNSIEKPIDLFYAQIILFEKKD